MMRPSTERMSELAELIVNEARHAPRSKGVAAEAVNLFLLDFHNETFRDYSYVTQGPDELSRDPFKGTLSSAYLTLIDASLAGQGSSNLSAGRARSLSLHDLGDSGIRRLLRSIPQWHGARVGGFVHRWTAGDPVHADAAERMVPDPGVYQIHQKQVGELSSKTLFDMECGAFQEWLTQATLPKKWTILYVAPLIRNGLMNGLLYEFSLQNHETGSDFVQAIAASARAAEEWLERYQHFDFMSSLTERDPRGGEAPDAMFPWGRFIEALPRYANVLAAVAWRPSSSSAWIRRPDVMASLPDEGPRVFELTSAAVSEIYEDDARERSRVEQFRCEWQKNADSWRTTVLDRWSWLWLPATSVSKAYQDLCARLGFRFRHVLRVPLALVSPRYSDVVLDFVFPDPIATAEPDGVRRRLLLRLFPMLEEAEELFAESAWRDTVQRFVTHDFNNLLRWYSVVPRDQVPAAMPEPSSAVGAVAQHSRFVENHLRLYGRYMAIPRNDVCGPLGWEDLVLSLRNWRAYVRTDADVSLTVHRWPAGLQQVAFSQQLLLLIVLELMRNYTDTGSSGNVEVRIDVQGSYAMLVSQYPRPSEVDLEAFQAHIAEALTGSDRDNGLPLLFRLLHLAPGGGLRSDVDWKPFMETPDLLTLRLPLGHAWIETAQLNGERRAT